MFKNSFMELTFPVFRYYMHPIHTAVQTVLVF
jgi:hypothetical protein